MKLKELFESEERSILSVKGEQPHKFNRDYYCNHIQLTSLQGSPSLVTGSFHCYNNDLTSLKGGPKDVSKDFHCFNNELVSLEGAPTIIGGNFYCSGNKLTSLKGIHKIIKLIGSVGYFDNNLITSNVLGLLKIEELRQVKLDEKKVERIINKHLKGDRDIFACQEDLVNAGFEDFAKL